MRAFIGRLARPEPGFDVFTPLKVRTRHSLFRQDRFACFRRSFFCWKARSPCHSEVVPWRSSLLYLVTAT